MTGGLEPIVQLAECAPPGGPPGEGWLGPAERAVLAGFAVAKRASDWRLGRWCAKQAVCALVVAPALTDIDILAAADGAPVVHGVDGVQVSISHRDGRAAAVACAAGLRLGCDLERVEPRSDAFIRDYFTSDEAAQVLARPAGERAVLANLCWSAKESVLKAERVGLRADTRAVEVVLPAWSGAEGWQALEARSASRHYVGRWRLAGQWLLTVLAERPHRLRSGQSVF